MLKIAPVSQVDYEKGMVKVKIPDRDNAETNWLAMESFEYEMPAVNDLVRVDLDDDDYTTGICKSRYYNETNLPTLQGEHIYYKEMLRDMVFIYNREEKRLYIVPDNVRVEGELLEIFVDKIVIRAPIEIEGNIFIRGDVEVDGNIRATGTILDESGNTNHHTH